MALTVNEYFLIPPNWNSGLSLKRQWRTRIQRSINNKVVKRSALFTWPRRTLSFSCDGLSYAQAAYIKRSIYKNLSNVWGIPFWEDVSYLTSDATSGQAVLTVDSTENKNYEVGGEAIIYSDQDNYYVGIILSKTSTTITFTDNLPITWVSGISVYPILKGRIEKTQNITYHTDQTAEIKIMIVEEFDEVTRNTPSVSGFPIHKGIPVFNIQPDWIQPIEEDQIHNYEMLQYLGKNRVWDQWDDTDFRYKAMYYGEDKEGAQNILDFFDYHKGRWGAFWRPSWFTDIKVTSAALVGDISIEIEDIDFASYWEDENSAMWLMLIWPDNTYEFRAVKSVHDSTHINLHIGLGKNITSADLPGMMISFLSYCHFNQDEIEANYITDSKIDVTLNFRNVAFETPVFTTTTTTTTSTSSSTTSTSSSTTSTSSSTTTTTA